MIYHGNTDFPNSGAAHPIRPLNLYGQGYGIFQGVYQLESRLHCCGDRLA